MNEATPQTAVVERKEAFDLSPRNLDEAMRMADLLANSSIVPKDFQKSPGNILVAVQWGAEIGLKPMQAMQNIAVINGRPSLWGDAVLALVLASPVCVDVIEKYEGSGDDMVAVCIAKRHGREDKVSRFSIKDAKAAGLLGKAGPWTQYRDRMLKLRARAFALRDQFTDVLKGMPIAEEVMDIPVGQTFDHKPGSPAAIAVGAQGNVQDSPARVELVKQLEDTAAKGKKSLGDHLRRLSKDDRKLIGPVEIERLGALALDEPTAADIAKPASTAKLSGAPQGPTYAELMDRLKQASTPDDVSQVLADCGHLPADQIEEIKAECAKAGVQ